MRSEAFGWAALLIEYAENAQRRTERKHTKHCQHY